MSNDVLMTKRLPDIPVKREWKFYTASGAGANDFMIVDDPWTYEKFVRDWDDKIDDNTIKFFTETNYLNLQAFKYWTGWALTVRKCDVIAGIAIAKPLYYCSKSNAAEMGNTRNAVGQMISFLKSCSKARTDETEVIFMIEARFMTADNRPYMRVISNCCLSNDIYDADLEMYTHISPSDGQGYAAIPVLLKNDEVEAEKCLDPDAVRPTGWTRLAKAYMDGESASALTTLASTLDSIGYTLVFMNKKPDTEMWSLIYYRQMSDIFDADEAKAGTEFVFDSAHAELSYFTDACFSTDDSDDLSGFEFDDDNSNYMAGMEKWNEKAAEGEATNVATKVLQKAVNLVSSQVDDDIEGSDIEKPKEVKPKNGKGKRSLNVKK